MRHTTLKGLAIAFTLFFPLTTHATGPLNLEVGKMTFSDVHEHLSPHMNLTEVGVNPDRAYSDHPGYVALSPLGGLAGIENLTMIATSFSSDGLLVSATAAYTQESWIPIKRALNNLYGEPRRIDDNHLEYMSESGIHIRAQRSPVQPTGTLMPSIAYRTPKYVEWQLNRDKAELSDQF